MTTNRKLLISAGHGLLWAALFWTLANAVWLPWLKTASFNANKTYIDFFIEANRQVGPVALGLGAIMAAQKVTFFAWKRSFFWLWPAVGVGAFAFGARKVLFPSIFTPDHRWGIFPPAAVILWPYVLGIGSTVLVLNVLLKRAHSRKYA